MGVFLRQDYVDETSNCPSKRSSTISVKMALAKNLSYLPGFIEDHLYNPVGGNIYVNGGLQYFLKDFNMDLVFSVVSMYRTD